MTDQVEPADVGPAARARQRAPYRWIRWTKPMKEMFLDHLAGSGNVTTSAQAIGIDDARAVHHLRRRDPAFALDWEVAVEAGYLMIETRLIGHVLAGGSRTDPMEGEGGAIHFEDALRLLAIRDARLSRQVKKGLPVGGRALRALASETDAAILKQLRITEDREQGA